MLITIGILRTTCVGWWYFRSVPIIHVTSVMLSIRATLTIQVFNLAIHPQRWVQRRRAPVIFPWILVSLFWSDKSISEVILSFFRGNNIVYHVAKTSLITLLVPWTCFHNLGIVFYVFFHATTLIATHIKSGETHHKSIMSLSDCWVYIEHDTTLCLLSLGRLRRVYLKHILHKPCLPRLKKREINAIIMMDTTVEITIIDFDI